MFLLKSAVLVLLATTWAGAQGVPAPADDEVTSTALPAVDLNECFRCQVPEVQGSIPMELNITEQGVVTRFAEDNADAVIRKLSFTLQLFHKLHNQREDSNLFFSPYSIRQALLLSLFGAKGETNEQVRHLLGLDNNTCDTRALLDELRNEKDGKKVELSSIQFSNANKLYFAQEEPLKECTKAIFQERELEQISFADSGEAARQINAWVENRTNGHIRDLIPPSVLSSESRLALVNSAYFKGEWAKRFDKSMTKLSLFYNTPTNPRQTKLMYIKDKFRHGVSEDLKSYILELPYRGDTHSMIILLPPLLHGAMNETISRLTPETLFSGLEGFRTQKIFNDHTFYDEVEIEMPRFALEQEYDIKKALVDLGVSNLFNPDKADLSNFSEKPHLRFEEALHKAFLEVHEDGAEAAAATGFISSRSGRIHPINKYQLNRPFIFFIVDKSSDFDVLFAGIFKIPKSLRNHKRTSF